MTTTVAIRLSRRQSELDTPAGMKAVSLAIVLHTQPIAPCLALANPTGIANLQVLSLGVLTVTMVDTNFVETAAPTDAGSFVVYSPTAGTKPGTTGSLTVLEYDDGGTLIDRPAYATSGTIQLDETSSEVNGRVSGSYDVDFDPAMHLQGTFSTTICGRLVEQYVAP